MDVRMHTVTALVTCVMPRVSACSARVIEALIVAGGTTGAAHAFARSVGLRNRDQLRRALAADGLPCLEDLAGWIRVFGWILEAEGSGISLSRGALTLGEDPKSRYRTVKRLTGRAWGEVRLLGSDWLLLQFADVVGRPREERAAS
jgi:hypothetical protein